MKIPMNAITHTIELLLRTESRQATKFLSPTQVVRTTRIKKNNNISIMLTVGKPNFAEREFIKKCKKASEPFPVKKVQLKSLKKKG